VAVPAKMGSKADLPDSLAEEVKKLKELFWVGRDKLKSICERFGQELQEGLEANGRNIVRLDTDSISSP